MFQYLAVYTDKRFFFYGLEVHISSVFYVIYRIFAYIILMFPLLFTFGWIPQSSTLTMVILEGMHVHMFGGTGFVNLTSAILHSVFDLAMVGILLGVGYYSVDTRRFGKDYISGIYGAVLVALSYVDNIICLQREDIWQAEHPVIFITTCHYLPMALANCSKSKSKLMTMRFLLSSAI